MKSRKQLVIITALLMLVFLTPVISQAKTHNKIRFTNKKIALQVGSKKKLSLKTSYKSIKWKSSKKKVATVSKKGVVKAVNEGTAKITAYNKYGKAVCVVKVVKVVKVDDQELSVKKSDSDLVSSAKTGDIKTPAPSRTPNPFAPPQVTRTPVPYEIENLDIFALPTPEPRNFKTDKPCPEYYLDAVHDSQPYVGPDECAPCVEYEAACWGFYVEEITETNKGIQLGLISKLGRRNVIVTPETMVRCNGYLPPCTTTPCYFFGLSDNGYPMSSTDIMVGDIVDVVYYTNPIIFGEAQVINVHVKPSDYSTPVGDVWLYFEIDQNEISTSTKNISGVVQFKNYASKISVVVNNNRIAEKRLNAGDESFNIVIDNYEFKAGDRVVIHRSYDGEPRENMGIWSSNKEFTVQ